MGLIERGDYIMNDIVIIGAGGVGKEVAMLIEQINHVHPIWNLVGFLDDNIRIHNTYINGYKVLGGVDEIANYKNIFAVCAISSYKAKIKIINKLKNYNIRFPKIIHPSVYVPQYTVVGEGTIIYPGVIMTTNIDIGKHVIVSPNCGIGHEAIIGDFCSILWNVNIAGNVRINTGCMLGAGSTVIQNIKVGREATIGAGSVVVRDLPEGCTAVGVPARVIKTNDKVEYIYGSA
jgi:sugar O-acyltransferase (sialic acid O-acetyltransferase NeuD family)